MNGATEGRTEDGADERPDAPEPRPYGPAQITLLLCGTGVLVMLCFSLVPSLLPAFIAEWSLTNTQAGILAGAILGGYMLAVPVLVSLTDRIDARYVYIASTATTGLAMAGFGLLADSFETAIAFQVLAGAGLGGTYMPGLKLLGDRVSGPRKTRYLSFYTASFSVGTAMSYFASGAVGAAFGWRWAAACGTIGAILAGSIVLTLIRDKASQPARGTIPPRLFDFRPVLRNRATMSYVLGYAAHMFELFALYGWLVAILVFTREGPPTLDIFAEAAALAALISLIGLPSSVIGNEFAMRFGRRRILLGIMVVSALAACVVGFASALPFGLAAVAMVAYSVLVTGDSGGLTAGAATSAPAGRQGATLAIHSTLGFGAAVLGSVTIGAVLDASGGMSVTGWVLAFATIGVVTGLGAVVFYFLGRGQEDNVP